MDRSTEESLDLNEGVDVAFTTSGGRVLWFDDSVSIGKKIRRVLHLIKGNANLKLWP